MSLHFVFRSEDHMLKALADPQIVSTFREMFAETVTGMRVLGLATLGFRQMYAKKEIHRVEDMRGMKVRVQATATEDAVFPAYGTQPGKAFALDKESQARLQKMGVKFVTDVDLSGFIKAATPLQDPTAKELGPYAVKLLTLIRAVQ